MQSSGLPRTIDLSREFKSGGDGVNSMGRWTTLKLHQTLGENFPGRPPECYDLRTVLGPDTAEYDFVAVRVAKILVKNKRFQKSTWLMLGLDNPNDQMYVHEVVDCIDRYYTEGVAN